MQPELKAITLELKAIDGEDPNGEFEAILSTPQLDRDGETVAAGAFNPLPESIPVHYAHDFVTGQPPIGTATPYYDGDLLKVKGRFAPTARAQEFRELVNGGFIKSMSAGFMTTQRKGKSILKGDLFEGSLTAVPVNPTAMVLASKSVTDYEPELKAGARNSKSDATMIQAIHDNASSLGADCSGMKSLKSIVGSVEAQQDRVRDALEDAYGEYCCWLRGVLPDTVVFDWNGDTWQQPYTDDGSVVTLTGTATEVDIHEVVAPDADADRETDEPTPGMTLMSVTPKSAPITPAATAASSDTAAATDEEMERQRQRVRAWQHIPA